MFARNASISNEDTSNHINLNSDEFFDALNKNDVEKVKSFFMDPGFKVWQLKDENNYTALHFSVLKNNYELTLFIIDELKKRIGMSNIQTLENFINSKNKEGITPLHYAVSNGNIEILQLLKKFGANLDAVTNTGKNIMHIAAGSNQPSMLIYLLLNEAQDISSVDENGSTPLHWACYYGGEEAVNYLLSLKVDINAQDKEKYTPLHLAVSHNTIGIVKLLLHNGADKNILNKYNELPLDIAKKKNYQEIVNILTNKDYNPLCTLESPNEYIQPSDIYKKIIFLMIIIPEGIIIVLVLPFLESAVYYIISAIFFLLCLLSYIILLGKDPGYQKNYQLLNECGGESDNKPLKKLVENGSDLKVYCPTCFILRGENKKHCFICNKCVLEMNHHCFWINKCIGKKNWIFYIIFIFCAFSYSNYSLFICLNLMLDDVNIPYKMKFLPDGFYLGIDRGLRVLGAGIVAIFSGIITFPLFFLFMIEIFKSFGLLGKKKNINLIDLDNNKIKEDEKIEHVEMQSHAEPLIEKDSMINEEGNNSINDDGKKSKISIPNENFPIVENRPSNTE